MEVFILQRDKLIAESWHKLSPLERIEVYRNFGRWFTFNWYRNGSGWLSNFLQRDDSIAKATAPGANLSDEMYELFFETPRDIAQVGREARELEKLLAKKPTLLYLISGVYNLPKEKRKAWGCKDSKSNLMGPCLSEFALPGPKWRGGENGRSGIRKYGLAGELLLYVDKFKGGEGRDEIVASVRYGKWSGAGMRSIDGVGGIRAAELFFYERCFRVMFPYERFDIFPTLKFQTK